MADWATRMLPSKSWFAGFFFEQFLPEQTKTRSMSASTAGTTRPSDDDGDHCPVDLVVDVLTGNNRACRAYYEKHAQETLPLQRKPGIGKCCLVNCFFNTWDECRKLHDIALANSSTFPGCGHYLDSRALRRLLETVKVDFFLIRQQQRAGGIRWDELDALQKYIAEIMVDVNRGKEIKVLCTYFFFST